MTNAEYHKTEAISNSDLDLFAKKQLKFKSKLHKPTTTEAMLKGSLIHKMVLEPETLNNEYVKIECTARANSNEFKNYVKDLKTQYPNAELIKPDVWEECKKMAENVKLVAGDLLSDGVAEKSFFADDEEYNIKRKCRPDYFRNDGTVIDLKTMNGNDFPKFAYKMADMNYDRQASWYLQTLSLAGEFATDFVFIVVNTASYEVDIYEVSKETLNNGEAKIFNLLNNQTKFKEC